MSNRHPAHRLITSLALLALGSVPMTSYAQNVGQGASNCAYATIQEAIDAAPSGGTVWIPVNGTYEENLVITKKLYLRGAEANGQCNTAVTTGAKAVLKPDPAQPSSVLEITVADTVSLFDLHIREGSRADGFGSGIHAHWVDLTLYDTVVAGYYHIGSNSPAYEQCASSPMTDDLDLHPRPMGDLFDAGAFEVQNP